MKPLQIANYCFLAVVFVVLQIQTAGQTKSDLSWTIDPEGISGQITKTTTEADLKRIFGEQNVQDHEVYLGESNFEKGTALYPGDPQNLIAILWKDDQGKRFPKEVFVGGIENGNYAARSLWQTTYGIGLGMSLKSLEKINRRPFRLAGFGWDDEGTVHSWSGGILEKAFGSKSGRKVFIRLNPDNSHLAEVRQVSGDADFSSGHPAMQTINPQIFQMIFVFSRN